MAFNRNRKHLRFRRLTLKASSRSLEANQPRNDSFDLFPLESQKRRLIPRLIRFGLLQVRPMFIAGGGWNTTAFGWRTAAEEIQADTGEVASTIG